MADVPGVLAEELREAIDLSTTSSDIFIMRDRMKKAADYLESISVPVSDEVLHEHVSLAIATWSLGLPVTITLNQRQELHDAIIIALHYAGVVPSTKSK